MPRAPICSDHQHADLMRISTSIHAINQTFTLPFLLKFVYVQMFSLGGIGTACGRTDHLKGGQQLLMRTAIAVDTSSVSV